jgi:MerR family mercuric resistance operon transcriptional regulator
MMRQAASTEPAMTIGQLARRAGVGIQAVRYYERRHLLPAAARRASGYREFKPAALVRLRFIRRAQELGFTLSEIAELLALRLDPHTTAADVKARAEQKIDEIDGKIRDLERIRHGLTHLAGRCRGGRGPTGDCPLLDALGPLSGPAGDVPDHPVKPDSGD